MVITDYETKLIHLSEIYAVIIESTAITISSYLISELMNNNIAVIFCNNEHNPIGQSLPLYGHHHSTKNILTQASWLIESKSAVWTAIVAEKIKNQALHLKKINNDKYKQLFEYYNEIEFDDSSNREGHSAKVYFNSLFGKGFSRKDKNPINSALNYGYAILLSFFNREIVSSGYITQLGIKHKNEYNDFNLSCDLMEPFRILIDIYVKEKDLTAFEPENKYDIINLFNQTFNYSGGEYYLNSIIRMYVKSVISAIEDNNPGLIEFLKIYEE